MCGSLGSALRGVAGGAHRIVVQSDRVRSPLLPGMPSIFEFLAGAPNVVEIDPDMDAWDALNAVGRSEVAPPGVPEGRMALLRGAFAKAKADPEFGAMTTEAECELA